MSIQAAASLVFILGVASIGFSQVVTDVRIPADYLTFTPPNAGGSYVDAQFGTTIKRISSALDLSDNANGGTTSHTFVMNEYSSMTPFNHDSSRLVLQHGSYFALYDGNGAYIRDLPLSIHASSEPRWSRREPDVIYFVNGNQLKQYSTTTEQVSVVHTFSEYTSIKGKGESDICFDGDHLVLAGDNREIFVYDIAQDRKRAVLDAGTHGFDNLYITPNDNVTVMWYNAGTARYNGVELFDIDMNFVRQVTRVGGHMDVTRDTNGDEVLVWVNAADTMPICPNGIVKVRLSDATQTCLMTLDWSLASHISATDKGWVVVGTYNTSDPIPPAGWFKYTNELFQLKIDGTELKRLAHHRSRPFNGYNYTPRASVSRDGSRVVYSSNYGLQSRGYPNAYSDAYLMNIDAPPPVDGSTTKRYEESSPLVGLSGRWILNNRPVHSGKSAVLAVEAGSRASFTFNDTAVRWIGYRDAWAGFAKVYIDGQYSATVDTYSPSNLAQQVLFSASGLPAGSHTLVVEVTGTRSAASGGSWVWLDGFEAGPADPAAPAAVPVVSTTRFEQNSSAVEYTGTWAVNTSVSHSAHSAVLAVNSGYRATFNFTGNGARWIAYRDQWAGQARIYVDGQYRTTIDTYAAPSKAQSFIYSMDSLASGPHSLTVEVSGTRNPSSGGAWVWIDAFEAISATNTTSRFTTETPDLPSLIRVEQDDVRIQYQGSWPRNGMSLHSGGSAVLSNDPTARATFTFTGTQIKWIGYSDQWSGIANVYVDGVFQAEVDTYRATGASKRTLFESGLLSVGPHTIVIEVTGRRGPAASGNWVWLDAFDYNQ